jgi:TIR domain
MGNRLNRKCAWVVPGQAAEKRRRHSSSDGYSGKSGLRKKTMPTIFLSYRRVDSMEVTGRIYDRLVEYLGAESVFRDLDSIPLGVPFPDLLRKTLSQTDAILVIIGPTWLSITNEHGQHRLEESNDFVRVEVETALQLEVPIIPVIVSSASLPEEHELPQSIRALTHRNSFVIRPDPDFHRDMDRLCTKLQEVLGLPEGTVRKSELVNKQIQQLDLQNKRLQDELALQNELMKIDRAWEAERERHKVQYAQGSVPIEPTLGSSVAGAIICLFALIGFRSLMLPRGQRIVTHFEAH